MRAVRRRGRLAVAAAALGVAASGVVPGTGARAAEAGIVTAAYTIDGPSPSLPPTLDEYDFSGNIVFTATGVDTAGSLKVLEQWACQFAGSTDLPAAPDAFYLANGTYSCSFGSGTAQWVQVGPAGMWVWQGHRTLVLECQSTNLPGGNRQGICIGPYAEL